MNTNKISPKKSSHQDFQAASQAVELEYNAVKRLKRLSIGNSLNFDPDLPPSSSDSYFIDKNNHLNEASLKRSKSILSNNSVQSTSSLSKSFDSYDVDDDATIIYNKSHSNDQYADDDDDDIYDDATEDSDLVNLSRFSEDGSSTHNHDEIDFNDDNVDFLDLDPDSSFNDSDIMWVPATAHPKLSPENFQKHIKNTVDEIQTKLQRSGSVKSSLHRETSALKDDNNKENIDVNTEKERSGLQIRKPSLKELTAQLDTLSKRAGLDNNDAITLARSLSTRSIGITKLEKEVYSQNENEDPNLVIDTPNPDQIPDSITGLNRARSRKMLLRNKMNTTRESLFIKDELLDDSTTNDDLIDMNNNLQRGRRTNYSRQQNNAPLLPNLPSLPQNAANQNRNHLRVHVYKDIQKIHNAQKPLGRPQLEPIKSKTPSSRLPDLPSSNSSPTTPTAPTSGFNTPNHTSSNKNRNYNHYPQQQQQQQHSQQQLQQFNRQPVHKSRQQYPPQQQQYNHQGHPQQFQQYPQNLYQQQLPQKHHHHQQQQPQQQHHNYLPQQRRNHGYNQIDEKQQRIQQNLYRQQQQNQHASKAMDDKNRLNNYSNVSNQTAHSRNRYINDRNVLDTKKQLVNERINTNEQGANPVVNNRISPVEELKKLSSELENMKISNQSKDSVISVENTIIEESEPLEDIKHGSDVIGKVNEIEIESDKDKEKDGKSKSKSAFSSFFKIKRDKPRSVSHNVVEPTDEPKLTFKVKRSLSHSSESSGMNSPKDFKSFFGGKKEKEKEKEKVESIPPIVKKNVDASPSSPKLGGGLFSSNILTKSKENVNDTIKKEANLLGFQHKHKKEKEPEVAHNVSTDNRRNNVQISGDIQQKENIINTSKVEPVELKAGDQSRLSSDSNDGLIAEESERSKSVVESNITSISSVSDTTKVSQTLDEHAENKVAFIDTASDEQPLVTIPIVDSNEVVQQPQQPKQQTPQLQRQQNAEVLPENESNELIKRSLEETLQQNERPSKPNQPLEMRDSAFGFPLPPVSHSTLVMLDHRFPVQVERAIYRLSHLKLADPKRPLRQQVLLSNFMYSYLNLVNHTLWIQSKEQENNDNEMIGNTSDNSGMMIESPVM